jgi:hydrogenase maturation protease
MKTVIIGLGNPIMSDDSVGIKIVRELKERVNSELRTPNSELAIVEAYAGGLRLMDELAGYDRAVIIDAMVTGNKKPGTVQILPLSSLISTRNMTCMHDTNIPTALELGSMLGLKLPNDIIVFGIEAKDVETFGEELTTEVAEAVPIVVRKVMQEVIGNREVKSML